MRAIPPSAYLILCVAVMNGCNQPGADQPAQTPLNAASRQPAPDHSRDTAQHNALPNDAIQITWLADDSTHAVEITGLPTAELDSLRAASLEADRWSGIFSVRVKRDGDNADQPPIVGDYVMDDTTIRFRPRFPLSQGVTYRATLDREGTASISGRELRDSEPRVIASEFTLPAQISAPTAVVTAVHPTAEVLPENQLKLYIHFSAPMSRGDVYKHIHLIESSGKQVDSPFLELDEELWDRSGQRFTLFFDPGRIKRGLKPREEFGPVLEEGKQYTLRIDAQWRDAHGNPLREPFEKTFRVAPPDDEQPDPNAWQLVVPAQATREPLLLRFPEPLDHAMLQHVIGVVDSRGEALAGTVTVRDHAKQWSFAPDTAWEPGKHQIRIQSNLEDLAGNSIAKPFEIDVLHPIERRTRTDLTNVDFDVGPAQATREAVWPR